MSRLYALLQLERPLVMGILNVTPDSFFDGGRFESRDAAIEQARHLIEAGADILDVGGESTRPGADPVSATEEIERVLPVIRAVRESFEVAISIDSSKPEVMQAAISEDIDLVNDVFALQKPGALEVVAAHDIPVCLMHMKGQPGNMQVDPTYNDVVAEVMAFFEARMAACKSAGIGPSRIILDVGFGFGKQPHHNLTLINQLKAYRELGRPLLVGLSRKSTIGLITDDRLTGSISGALAAAARGANILRVHDVAETVAALRVWRSIEQEQIAD